MKNWKTTLAGVIAGAGPLLDGLSSALSSNQPIHWSSLLAGLGLVLLGAFAHDAKSTPQVNVATNQ